jgi:hypothetical protein
VSTESILQEFTPSTVFLDGIAETLKVNLPPDYPVISAVGLTSAIER